ncbi:hypothetical protein GH714_004943 [Hevea brasiliensis]|uniref:Transposase MuDR plant domain-containing protein n=1 Tax=Hevea brasiliensis TaxID=3981 RepID=A0A6A6L9N4_HEVBR|nr:hypothetical protein GH714_004943 [Hevea brasiliensis]
MPSDSDVLERVKCDDNGDNHLYVKALEGQDSEGENQPGINIGGIQGTPQSKLNENDAISLNYEMLDSDDNVLGDNENNVEKCTSVDLAEKCPIANDDNNEDSNYDPNANRVLTGDDELENEAFDDYVTDDSEFQPVRKDRKKKTASDNVVSVTDIHEVPILVFDDMVNKDIPIGMKFVDSKQCKEAIQKYAICNGFNVRIIKSEKKRLGARWSINAIYQLTPKAEHRNCAKLIWANWKKIHRGEKYKKLFWGATYATEFQTKIDEINGESKAAFKDFMSQDPYKFCNQALG